MIVSRMASLFCVLFILSASFAAHSQPATRPAPKAPVAGEVNKDGLTATLVANKTSYLLDPAQSGKDFRDQISPPAGGGGGGGGAGRRGGGLAQLPKPPSVDLTLVITNTSNQNITITLGGDSSQIQLDLSGPGAVSVDNLVAMTMDYRIGNPVTLAPGKTTEIKITSLAFGTRGISKYAYWTEPGDYTLSATLLYALGETQGKVISAKSEIKITK